MKKHKSVVAILLAVMMIFTMMPMMAFAADEPVWDTTSYSSVTIGTQTYKNIKKTWAAGTGKMTAAIDWDDVEGAGSDAVQASVDYYDFSRAQINAKGTWTNTAFTAAFPEVNGERVWNNASVAVYDPTKPTDTTTNKVVGPEFDGLEVKVYAAGFDAESYDAMTVTLTAVVAPKASGSAANQAIGFVGAVASKTITVQGKSASADSVAYAVDDLTKGASLATGKAKIAYDGDTHKVVNSTVPGFSVAYKLQNPKTKVYEAVSAVEMKDAGEYYFSATVTNTTTNVAAAPKYFQVTIDKASDVTFNFDQNTSATIERYYYVKEGVEYDAYDFVEPSGDKAAVAANKEELMAWFKDNYEITEEPYKYDDTLITLQFKAKEVDAKAMAAKYATLLGNFGTLKVGNTTSALLKIVPKTAYYEIEFTNSPVKKTYKAKVLKKKAKSFKVHAECTTGETVNYKLINAPAKIVINKTTGKITLKKGLKKGTYKITVKAYVPLKGSTDSGYNGETHNITIKVKK